MDECPTIHQLPRHDPARRCDDEASHIRSQWIGDSADSRRCMCARLDDVMRVLWAATLMLLFTVPFYGQQVMTTPRKSPGRKPACAVGAICFRVKSSTEKNSGTPLAPQWTLCLSRGGLLLSCRDKLKATAKNLHPL